MLSYGKLLGYFPKTGVSGSKISDRTNFPHRTTKPERKVGMSDDNELLQTERRDALRVKRSKSKM